MATGPNSGAAPLLRAPKTHEERRIQGPAGASLMAVTECAGKACSKVDRPTCLLSFWMVTFSGFLDELYER
jgi:hypothetical protein